MTIIKRTLLILLAIASVLVGASSYASGQQQVNNQQQMPVEDPVRQLNLSPEQREKIRAIREQLKDERAAINQRLRETNAALEEALDADNPDEAVLEQRMRDASAAQAASMRMRILSEVRIRRVLTPDQISTLRTLQKRSREARRMENIERRREAFQQQRGITPQRNGVGPLLRRAEPRRANRP